MIDEEVAADRRAGMDVDRGQEAREVIDRAREQEQPRLEQPVRGPVQPQRPDAGIKHDLPTRSRGGIARLDRIEITGQPARSEEHTSELQSLMRTSYAVFCLKKKNN